ncbi:hypothetical protein SprV_0200901300 [Sparganum proliferum]
MSEIDYFRSTNSEPLMNTTPNPLQTKIPEVVQVEPETVKVDGMQGKDKNVEQPTTKQLQADDTGDRELRIIICDKNSSDCLESQRTNRRPLLISDRIRTHVKKRTSMLAVGFAASCVFCWIPFIIISFLNDACQIYFEGTSSARCDKLEEALIYTIWLKHIKTDGEPNQTPEVLRVLPYMRNVSEAAERMPRPLNVGVGHRPEATIRRLVTQPKGRLPPEDMSGVIYRVKCLDCPANYCGMTNKRLKTHMHEHNLAVKRKDARSHVAMHSLEDDHPSDFDGAQVLSRAENRLAREIIEAWQTDAKSINRSVDLPAPYGAAKHH